ncbi:hypothetical protein [Metakosakonia massiliensis]
MLLAAKSVASQKRKGKKRKERPEQVIHKITMFRLLLLIAAEKLSPVVKHALFLPQAVFFGKCFALLYALYSSRVCRLPD